MTEQTQVEIQITPGVNINLDTTSVNIWTSTVSAERQVRYIVKDMKELAECFDPLIKSRDKNEADLEKVRKDSRTRGYLLMGAQIGTFISLFLPFVRKNFKNERKKFTGMSLYILFILGVGLLISLSLWHMLKKFGSCKEKLEKLMVETQMRLQKYGIVLQKSEWDQKVAAVAAAVAAEEAAAVAAAQGAQAQEVQAQGAEEIPAETPTAKLARMYLDDELIRIKIRELCVPLDFGWMGKKLVWIEMGVASITLVSLAVAATISRIA